MLIVREGPTLNAGPPQDEDNDYVYLILRKAVGLSRRMRLGETKNE